MRRPVVLVLALAAVACTRTLDMAVVHKSITEGVRNQTTLDVASVTCPETRDIKQADVFTCAVTPAMGGALEVTVTQADDAGNITWEVTKTEGLIDLSTVEQAVTAGLKTQLSVDATVSCGGQKFRKTEPGKTFDCTASTAAGERAPVTVTMQDAEGNINWALNAQQ